MDSCLFLDDGYVLRISVVADGTATHESIPEAAWRVATTRVGVTPVGRLVVDFAETLLGRGSHETRHIRHTEASGDVLGVRT